MCLRETSLTAQRPNLSISILPSLLPCLTGFPPASQWEWLLQQNKQKNTQIYIKTSPDVPPPAKGWFSHPGGISAVISSLSQQIPGSLLPPSLAICSAPEIYMKRLKSILSFMRKCMIWNIKGYLWSTIILDMAKNEILSFSQNTTYKKVTQACYHYSFLFFIRFYLKCLQDN